MSFNKLSLTFLILLGSFQIGSAQEAPKLGKFEASPRYQLLPGDVVEVQYRYTPEFNQVVTVQPDGFVTLEVVGDIKISKETLEQVRNLIQQKAALRLKDPEVTLILKEFQKPYFVVAGEVVQPGKIELRERMTALQAVMLAGGFKDSAKASQIILFRKINSDTAEVKSINLNKIVRTSDLERDFVLEPGDMLYVPQNLVTKISRYMKLANIGLYFNPLDVLNK